MIKKEYMTPQTEAIEIGTTLSLLAGSKIPKSEDEVTGGWSRDLDLLLDDNVL